ncbi:Conserved_hypothetical protein [Hexamita inflata]|uniref:Uncharacterized protein n=1 Tax=Hexamita inflata TaxID=28002 RepID=A0AA86QS10_9EUKA|nr:Conserved hypothetical protein [Hexamita inflata]
MNSSNANMQSQAQAQDLALSKKQAKSSLNIIITGVLSQFVYYLALCGILLQEQHIAIALYGSNYMVNSVKILPIIFVVIYDMPDFYESYYASVKFFAAERSESVTDILRTELFSNIVVTCLMLILPIMQSFIFSKLLVDASYKYMYLLALCFGLIEPFYASAYSSFTYKHLKVNVFTGKIMSLLIYFFMFTFSYSYQSRTTTNPWPSGLSKPFADVFIYVLVIIAIVKNSLFGTKLNILDNNFMKKMYKFVKTDTKLILRDLFSFINYLVYNASRPIVILCIIYQLTKITDEDKRNDAMLDVYIYFISQFAIALIGKGMHQGLLMVAPQLFEQKKFTQLRNLFLQTIVYGVVAAELIAIILKISPDKIVELIIPKSNDTLKEYFQDTCYIDILGYALIYATESAQLAIYSFAIVTTRYYLMGVIGLLRIIIGVFLVVKLESYLGQNADYTQVFFYFEIICAIIGGIFMLYVFLSFFTEFREVKIGKKGKEKKVRVDDSFMSQV